MAAARELWRAAQTSLALEGLIFIDETGANTKMVRTRGRRRRASG